MKYTLVGTVEFEALHHADACAKLAGHFRRTGEGNSSLNDLFLTGEVSLRPSSAAAPEPVKSEKVKDEKKPQTFGKGHK